MSGRCELIVALDLRDRSEALNLVDMLGDAVRFYKVGMELFYREGPSVIADVASRGIGVFLDVKVHDIPNTAAAAVRQLVEFGPAMLSLHAAGGHEMLRVAAETAGSVPQTVRRPLLVAVTLLTSIDADSLRREMFVQASPREYVLSMARLAKGAGVDGVVCSADEVSAIKEECGRDFVTVVPGVRPSWSERMDQKRVATPRQAAKSGADFIVVGRPITRAKDPLDAAMRILEEIK